MLEAGLLINGRYRILEEIGRGGMSRVYLSEDMDTGARKAIKAVRRSDIPENAGCRIVAEIDMLKKLRHPGLPRIDDVIRQKDGILIVMEHIPGSSLQRILKEFGAQPAASVIEWMIQLCGILDYMHTRKPPVVYRDVKPANIMLKPDGRIMLIDLGATREYGPSEAGDTVLLGTRGYAAPEQYGGQGQSGPRADIYGLGATAYHLLTGWDPSRPPFMRRPVTSRDPAIPASLARLVRKCTRHDPGERYGSCSEVLEELKDILKDLEISENGYTEVIAEREVSYRTETDILIVHTGEVLP